MYQPHIWHEIDRQGTYVDLSTHLMEQRTILIGSELIPDIATIVGMQVLTLARQPEPIQVYLNCLSGPASAGLAIVDVMRYVKSRGVAVRTYCLGECLGISVAILASGTPKERHIFSSGQVSLFQEWYGVATLRDELADSLEEERERKMNAVVAALIDAGVYPVPTDGTESEETQGDVLRRLLRTHHFLGAKTAIEYGIADEIVACS
jgi:ATP-dependent protease ClpP protease subunit